MKELWVAVILTAFVWSIAPARASMSECRDAIDRYNTIIGDIPNLLRSYTNCVSSSRGHDDCTSEFESLRSTQDDFESAVSDYESECDD